MSKDLKKEYSDMIRSDLPDLWDRINASLPKKNTQAEKAGKTKFYRWAGLAAACVCAAVLIPVAVTMNRTAGHASEAAMQETAAAETAVSYRAAASVQEEKAVAAAAEESASAAVEEAAPAAEIMEETAVSDKVSAGNGISAAEAIMEEVPEGLSAAASGDSGEADAAAEPGAEDIEEAPEPADIPEPETAEEVSAEAAEEPQTSEAESTEWTAAEEEAVPEITEQEPPAAAASETGTRMAESAGEEAPSEDAQPEDPAGPAGVFLGEESSDAAVLSAVSVRILSVEESGQNIQCRAVVLKDAGDGILSEGEEVTLIADEETEDSLRSSLAEGQFRLDLQKSTNDRGDSVWFIR